MADLAHRLTATCKQCGNDFEFEGTSRGPVRSRCVGCNIAARRASVAKWRKARLDRAREARICKECGSRFKAIGREVICSDKCRNERKKRHSAESQTRAARARGVRPIDAVRIERSLAAIKNCKQCGAEFKPSGGGSVRAFCSRQCGWDSQRKYANRAEERAAYRAKAGLLPVEETRRLRAEAKAQKELIRTTCIHCSTKVEPECIPKYGTRPVCLSCKSTRKEESRRRGRRVAKAKRRAAKRLVGAHNFDPLEVLMRDGWRCYICGVATPKELRGTYVSNAPEIDHVVPISRGGEHSLANTRCACRKCNHTKRDMTLEEYLRAA